MANLLADANATFVDDDFTGALKLYTAAIEAAKESGDTTTTINAHISRSICNYKMKKWTDALSDARTALSQSPGNAKALLRKGMAAFALEEYETAQQAFTEGLASDPTESRFKTWIRKCEAELAAEEDSDEEEDDGGDAPPPLEADTPSEAPAPTPAPTAPASAAATPAQDQPKAAPLVRHSWFQTPTTVTIDFFKKGVTEDQLEVEIKPKELDVIIQLGDSREYNLHLDLSDEKSKYTIRSTKVEVKLKKLNSKKWPSLENAETLTSWEPPKSKSAHSYPTSSRSAAGGRNWKKLAKDLGADEDEKLEGDAALNQVFRGIYKNASDEQRMAMEKSFQESGGTVLSTDWSQVKQKHVDGSPPKGMEMHSWSEKNH